MILRMILWILLFFTAALTAEEIESPFDRVRIYRDARKELLGRAVDRSSVIEIPLTRFLQTESREVSKAHDTACLISAETVAFLYDLTKKSEKTEARNLYVEHIESMTYRITFPDWGIDNIYRFSVPSGELFAEIEKVYSNTYWKEIVHNEYSGNYLISVLQAEDVLAPAGRADFGDALIAASLIAEKNQPLWGIHDGLGLLDGLGYAAIESRNRISRENVHYREFRTNRRTMQEILLTLRQSQDELASTVHTQVRSRVQYEEDDEFLLPEEMIAAGEGDCLEFALTFYDLLRRLDYETKLVALRGEPLDPDLLCDYITLYREEEFSPWGYIYYGGYSPPVYQSWMEVPAQVMQSSVFIYPLNSEQVFLSGPPELPPTASWSKSIY